MMRVAALCDIHGNLPALEAVLQEIRQAGADLIVVGGDLIPGPMPRECLSCLLDLPIPVRFLQGNGEFEVLAMMAGVDTGNIPERFRDGVRWVAQQLQPDDQQTLAGWPLTLRLPIPQWGEVLFCHATPRNNTEIFTRLTPEDRLLPVFAGLDVPLVVCGHTHMQFDRRVGDMRVVNAGSVGMPYADPAAYWLLLDSGVQLQQTAYDLPQAAQRIRETSYPQAEDFAANNVLQPPSETEALEAFSRAELK